MLQFISPFRSLRRLADEARRRMVQDRPRLLGRIGAGIQQLAVTSFEKRASGQPDAGITWQPLSPGYLRSKRRRGLSDKIGIATGRMLESRQYTVGPDGVTFSFTAPYAPQFHRARPLLPETLPDDWQEGLDQEAIEWTDGILVTAFEDTL